MESPSKSVEYVDTGKAPWCLISSVRKGQSPNCSCDPENGDDSGVEPIPSSPDASSFRSIPSSPSRSILLPLRAPQSSAGSCSPVVSEGADDRISAEQTVNWQNLERRQNWLCVCSTPELSRNYSPVHDRARAREPHAAPLHALLLHRFHFHLNCSYKISFATLFLPSTRLSVALTPSFAVNTRTRPQLKARCFPRHPSFFSARAQSVGSLSLGTHNHASITWTFAASFAPISHR